MQLFIIEYLDYLVFEGDPVLQNAAFTDICLLQSSAVQWSPISPPPLFFVCCIRTVLVHFDCSVFIRFLWINPIVQTTSVAGLQDEQVHSRGVGLSPSSWEPIIPALFFMG